MAASHFRHIPRRNRAKGLVPKLRESSAKFKRALKSGDLVRQDEASVAAWNALASLFEILRGEQDSGHLADELMQVRTGLVIKDTTPDELAGMKSKHRIDRSRSVSMSLRDTLNKIAHWQFADFRVDGKNAHYLIFSGTFKHQTWFAEVLVSRLCRNASAAISGISG